MIKRLLVAVAFTTAWCTAASAADFSLRCQSLWQGGTTNQRVFQSFAEEVKTLSKGRIAIEALPADAVAPSTEMIDATAAGILHCMHGGGALHIKKDPAFALVNDIPAGYDKPEQFLQWFYKGGGIELARELYGKHGVYYVGPVMWGAESIPVKKKVARIEDFKGVKMRSPEGIAAQMWRKLGVGVSTLAGSEVYTALDTGKIDATDWGSLGMNDQLGYNRIAQYAIYPGIHSMPAGEVAVHQATWDKLPADLKQVMVTAVRNLNDRMLAANEKLDAEAAAKRDPATLIAWSTAERIKLRKVARESWAEWSEKSPMAKKIYKSHIDFMQSISIL